MHVRISVGKNKLVLSWSASLSLVITIIANILGLSLSALPSVLGAYAFESEGSGSTTSVKNSLAGMLYVGDPQSNSISVVNLTEHAIVKNITLGLAPYDIKLSEDQLRLYVTDMHSGTLSIINTTVNEPVKQILTGVSSISDIAITNSALYIADFSGGKVLVMDENGTIANTINVGSRPQDIEVRPDGQVLYVANQNGPVSVVDLKSNKIIKEIYSGNRPQGLYFTRDGAKLFVVNTKSDTLSVIDSYKHEIIKTIPIGHNPQYVALSPDERFAYVTNTDSNTVSVVDAQRIELTNDVPVGNGPYGIALSPDGDLIYVSNIRGNDLSVINTTSNKLVDSLPLLNIGVHPLITRNPDIGILRTAYNHSSSDIIHVFVEVADDDDERTRGLMFRKNLSRDAGMLFIFYNEEPQTFWMKNTLIPLDMIFINSTLKIVDIKENVPPCIQGEECPLYPSREPAQYVLEVNAGFVQRNGIKIGDRFETATG